VQRQQAIQHVLWNETSSLWYDFDLSTQRQRAATHWFASSIAPVWAQVVDTRSNSTLANAIYAALSRSSALSFVGGFPTSLSNSGQQWDLPNGWAPLQAIAISALENLNRPLDAKQLAQKWLQNNYNGWLSDNVMFEKYNVSSLAGVPGGGGEYDVQAGFGWTNGVVLELLLAYST
jgi:alpha,alpha-trehalase